MPADFEKCRKEGGRIRTKKLSGGKYIHICIPKGGGKSVGGEVKKKKKKKSSPHGRIYGEEGQE
jgi:hypothetical protein